MTTTPSTTPQRDLMKHAAQASSRRLYRPATAAEAKKYKAPTEAILLFFAALNIAISDVRDELEAAGLYRHAVKRNLNAAEALIFRTYTALYKKLQTVESALTRLIDDLNSNMGRFVVAEALPMRHIVTYLKRIDVVPDHNIDYIIARKLRDMMDEDERKHKQAKQAK
jgi:hypothetical protein